MKCFNSGHAVLGVLATLMLTVCVGIIPLVLVYTTASFNTEVAKLFMHVKVYFTPCLAFMGVETLC